MLGSGAYTYEAIHDWGALPPQHQVGQHARRRRGRAGPHLRAPHRARDERERRHDRRLRSARDSSSDRGARSSAASRTGCTSARRAATSSCTSRSTRRTRRCRRSRRCRRCVVKTTLKGEIVWKIEGPPDIEDTSPGADGAPKPYNPTNIAIAPNGDIYVGDGYGSYYVNQYNSKAEYIRTFGGKGSEPGKLAEPHGIWVDTRGTSPILVVADRRNNRLQRFTLDGKHVDFVPGFRLPCHFDERKGLVVIPDLHGRVTLIDKHNQLVEHLGDSNAAELEQPAADASRATSSSPASSSARTAPASITTAISSSSSGSRSGG